MAIPNEVTIQNQLKDVSRYAKALIDAAIWYEAHDMDDWMYEIVAHIEKLEPAAELELLLSDLPSRPIDDIKSYGYQRIWLALINSGDAAISKMIKDYLANGENKTALSDALQIWINESEGDVETLANLQNIVCSPLTGQLGVGSINHKSC